MRFSATYSPEDDKLRLYSVSRLDDVTYRRVKDAGFQWAPKQELFFAVWSPSREDLTLDLAGEIDDEDKTLVERAEERAERFNGYSENRAQDAEHARAAVDRIADGIPVGQPILVGHHSERRARKDAERIESGMRKAVGMWRTSQYWTQRAAGARANANYKMLPAVRARRIKGLESDHRKHVAAKEKAERFIGHWNKITAAPPEKQHDMALFVANHDHISRCFSLAEHPRQQPASQYEGPMSLWSALTDGVIDAQTGCRIALGCHAGSIDHHERWIAHLANRIVYERAMLEEGGGLPASRFDIQPGGRVRVSRSPEWLVVIRVNKSGGTVTSITTNAPVGVTWTQTWKYGIETVLEYQAPAATDAQAVKAATKLAPLCNYPGEDVREMTKADWDRIHKDYKSTVTTEATELAGRHRRRMAIANMKRVHVFLTDAKRVDPPGPTAEAGARPDFARKFDPAAVAAPRMETRPVVEPNDFERMDQALRHGVKAVSVPQLFCTSDNLADQVVEEADIPAGARLLEPSAGTGRLLAAAARSGVDHHAVAIEINFALADQLRARFPQVDVHSTNFLECNGDLGMFDRILMNPPYENAADITHVEHALRFLKPGGRLVAICANGPRQNARLKPQATRWINLPAGSFREAGTNVNTALVVIDKAL